MTSPNLSLNSSGKSRKSNQLHTSRNQVFSPRANKFARLVGAFILFLCFVSVGFAATSSVSATGVTSPSGTLWLPGQLGGHLWIADHTSGLCRLDPTAPGSATPLAINSATCNLAASSPGQPDFDSTTNFVYVPDNSSKSQGVWRLIFDPATETVVTDIRLAPTAGLGGNRPSAVAFSHYDGKLYVSFLKNGNISRIATPAGASQIVEAAGSSSDGRRVVGLAFVDWDLYLAEKDQVTRIGCATSTLCKGSCKATAIGVNVATPGALTADDTNRILYTADLTKVYRFTLATSTLDTMSSQGSLNGTNINFQNISAVGLNGSGDLFIGDDPTAGASPSQGHLWMLPAGSQPDVAGGTPPPPAGLAVSTQYAPGVTAPYGPIFLPDSTSIPGSGHMWVADHTLGFCRLDPMMPGVAGTLYGINSATCSLAAVSPGQPSFDAASNSVYFPDTSSKSQGVWRVTFDPVTETVSKPVLLAPGKGLGGNRPVGTALGTDGKLYVSFIKNGSVSRITTPSGSTQTVEAVGSSSDARRVQNLAFIGNDLYLAETAAITRIIGATSAACAGGCKAASFGVAVNVPTAITSDGADKLFVADSTSAYRYTISTATLDIYSTGGTYNGSVLTFSNISGLSLDPSGNLFIGDDPTAGAQTGQGRIWQAGPVQ
jgi:streptogramin lyase